MVLGMGCHSPGDSSSTKRPASEAVARALAPVLPANALIVDTVLLERPLGDPFLNRDLWTSTFCTLTPETRELLTSNGLQVGILTGTYPNEFLNIVNNQAEAIAPHRLTFNHIKEEVIPSAGPIDNCKFELLADLAGKPERVTLEGARCGVLVRPERLPDGRVKIWCEPQIQHGQREERYRTTEDGTQLMKYEEVPTEKYPFLGFEIILRPEECLLIGSIAEQRYCLGGVLFESELNGNPRQRVAVIRTRVVNASPMADLPPITAPGRRGPSSGQ